MNELSTICPHFSVCSGCTQAKEVTAPPIWQEVQEYFGSVELITGALRGWRTKAKLAVRGTYKDPKIGLFRARSHDVEPIPECHAHHLAINRAVKAIEEAIREEKVMIYDEKRGLLRYVQCFVDLATGKVQLALIVQAQDSSLDRLCQRLLKTDLWHSIWLNIQSEANNKILGEQWSLLWGEPFLWQEVCGKKFPFHPGAFSQAHWTLFEKLAAQVVDWIPNGSKLLEIYAGVGVMSLLAEPKCHSVDLVENNPFSHLSFQQLKTAARYHLADARGSPLHADCTILDPPRKGVDPELLRAIQGERLIYVSCDFSTFVRDAKILQDAGWSIQEGKGYLLFPGTNHIETVALFI